MKNINEINLKKKKYLIFDLDGTLIDSIGIWNKTDQFIIKKYGNKELTQEEIQQERDDFLNNHHDTDIYLAYCEYIIKKHNLIIKDKEDLLKIRWSISSEILEKDMDFKKDVVTLLIKLKKLGFTLILATMAPRFQMEIYTKKNKKMLSQMNINEMFDLITTKDEVKNKKPHPEIYENIINFYHASKSECLIFEDSYTGVLASHNAGIEVVNIYDQYADIDREKINSLTDYHISNYKEFIDYIDEYFAKKYIKK